MFAQSKYLLDSPMLLTLLAYILSDVLDVLVILGSAESAHERNEPITHT